MAPRFDQPIEPMTLGNMRKNGVLALLHRAASDNAAAGQSGPWGQADARDASETVRVILNGH
jgi:hypothetical protein